jgi:hypothetical protein
MQCTEFFGKGKFLAECAPLFVRSLNRCTHNASFLLRKFAQWKLGPFANSSIDSLSNAPVGDAMIVV